LLTDSRIQPGLQRPVHRSAILPRARGPASPRPDSDFHGPIRPSGGLAQANSPPLLLEAETLIQRAPCKRLEGHFFRGKGNEAANRGDFAESVKMMRRAHQAFTEAGADGAVSNVSDELRLHALGLRRDRRRDRPVP